MQLNTVGGKQATMLLDAAPQQSCRLFCWAGVF